jgi:hypothetical protein
VTFTSRVRDLSSTAWASATWATPFVTQILLAMVIACSWLLGKVFVGAHGGLLFLFGAAAVLIPSGLAAIALRRSASPRANGLALSIAGSYSVVLVGGLLYGVWIGQW